MSKYCYSSDEEYFRSEEDHSIIVDDVISSFKTPQEALGAIYYRGVEEYPCPTEFFDIDGFIEDMMCKAYDEHGDYAENYFQDVSSKAIVELESLINSWLKQNVRVNFYHVKDIEQIKITQAQIDRYMLEYCPDDMTQEQMKTWEDSQKSVKENL